MALSPTQPQFVPDSPFYNRPLGPGSVVDGRYRLLELLGQGGMGAVYKAEHLGIGRTVAIKILHQSLASIREVERRFEIEALAVGRLEHPNCVDISDSGRLADGTPYIVMEFLEGRPLADILADDGPMAPLRALHILRYVLSGLSHAHQANLIHRDIKPENIVLVTQNGDPDFAKLLDFGVAKWLTKQTPIDTSLTQAGMTFGTPLYMSPEQALGSTVDCRADLYAATCVLFELITGKPPYYSDDKVEVLSMHTTHPVPTLRSQDASIQTNSELDALIQCGLAKRARDRFDNADSYIAAIDAIFAGRSAAVPQIRAASIPDTAPIKRPSQRTIPKGLGWLIGGATLLMIIGLAAHYMSSETAPPQAPTPTQAEPTLPQRAQSLMSQGAYSQVITLLETERRAKQDARAQKLLGHAYRHVGRQRDALRAYERALTLDPMSIRDTTLQAQLATLLDHSHPSYEATLALDAADILMTTLSLPRAADVLIALTTHKSPPIRHRAVELARKHTLTARTDRFTSLRLDLQQGETCMQRRQTVEDLRSLGDRRAIPAIKRALLRRGKYGNAKGKLINGCLRPIANTAIAELAQQ